MFRLRGGVRTWESQELSCHPLQSGFAYICGARDGSLPLLSLWASKEANRSIKHKGCDGDRSPALHNREPDSIYLPNCLTESKYRICHFSNLQRKRGTPVAPEKADLPWALRKGLSCFLLKEPLLLCRHYRHGTPFPSYPCQLTSHVGPTETQTGLSYYFRELGTTSTWPT